MGNRRLKFATAIAVLIGAALWLGMSGYEEGKSYYKTCDEFVKLEPAQQKRRIRLMGNVSAGTIERTAGLLRFELNLNGARVPVVYRGSDPVPDTFKDGVEAMVEGTAGDDGQFVARTIQAKCASKYDADPASAYAKPAPK